MQLSSALSTKASFAALPLRPFFQVALSLLLADMLAPASPVQAEVTLHTLHAFAGQPDDGAYPHSSLVEGSDGNFYGTTGGGGAGNVGTVYKMTPLGEVTVLYSFTAAEDGMFPYGTLLLADDGNFYGTTTESFAGDAIGGSVYRITPDGTFTVLYDFPGVAGGSTPYAGLVQGSDGKLYGTTFSGAPGSFFGAGTVFKMDLAGGTPTILHAFSGGADGGNPYYGALVEGNDGNFYGTTYGGGMVGGNFPQGTGTVFRITPTGTLTTIHTFTGGADGYGPEGGLVLGSDGNFYGTTAYGDFSSNTANGGTVFKITQDGVFTTLHTLTLTEGSVPLASLIEGSDGNFYGTAETGGDSNGTVFSVTPEGAFTVLYTFLGSEGRQPQSSLFQGSDGMFYGTAAFNGDPTALAGIVFRFAAPSPAAVFANISTRLNVLTGDNVLIGGFIITGADPKQVVLRAIGPSLVNVGVSGVLDDPTLSLYDSTGAVIATNDNWMENSTADQMVLMDDGLAPSDPAESAIVKTLDPGAYTAILSGVGGTTGVALVEAYGIDAAASSQLANISTRGLVETGDDVMIGGFIMVGASDVTNTIVLRGIGPSLTAQGVANALQDPTLELHDSNGAVVATNDNWMDSPDMQQIIDDDLAPTDERESAILAVLSPGAYTAILSGVGGSTGVALVEAYNLH
jgi:uncharacterized repeat protein (TIGR03803 family)